MYIKVMWLSLKKYRLATSWHETSRFRVGHSELQKIIFADKSNCMHGCLGLEIAQYHIVL